MQGTSNECAMDVHLKSICCILCRTLDIHGVYRGIVDKNETIMDEN